MSRERATCFSLAAGETRFPVGGVSSSFYPISTPHRYCTTGIFGVKGLTNLHRFESGEAARVCSCFVAFSVCVRGSSRNWWIIVLGDFATPEQISVPLVVKCLYTRACLLTGFFSRQNTPNSLFCLRSFLSSGVFDWLSRPSRLPVVGLCTSQERQGRRRFVSSLSCA